MINLLKDLFFLFDKKIKYKIYQTQILIIISSLFEIISVFSIAPFVQLISNNKILENNDQLISKIYNYLNYSSYLDFLIFVSIIILIIFVINFFISVFVIYYLYNFAYEIENHIKVKLFKFYLLQDWILHTRRDRSLYLNKILVESHRVGQGVVLSFLNTNSKLVIGIGIILLVFFYNPKISLICFLIFSFFYFFIFRFVKQKVEKYGNIVSNSNSSLYKKILETFAGIKETILHKKQERFYNEFNSDLNKLKKASVLINFLTTFPRNLLELLALSVIILAIILMTYLSKGTNLDDTLPILALYIFAGYKILPLFQSIYYGLVTIKSTKPALINILEEFSAQYDDKKTFPNIDLKDNSFNFKDYIFLKNVSFSYLNLEEAKNDIKNQKLAVNNINIKIPNNSFVSIVGPSGSGKSTILDIILGLLKPQKGEVLIDGRPLVDIVDYYQQNIGYVSQDIFLLNNTIEENICFGISREKIDKNKFFNAINGSNLSEAIKDFPLGIETVVGENGVKLSGGQKQRLSIARALYLDRKIIILDEATSSLDGISENFILNNLKMLCKNYNKTVIMVTHKINLTKFSDIIYLVNKGKIEDHGKFEELIKHSDVFKKLLNE